MTKCSTPMCTIATVPEIYASQYSAVACRDMDLPKWPRWPSRRPNSSLTYARMVMRFAGVALMCFDGYVVDVRLSIDGREAFSTSHARRGIGFKSTTLASLVALRLFKSICSIKYRVG